MDELYDEFIEKTDYLTETKGLLKDRINSLGGSITSGTTFRDYLVWLDSLYEALDEKTITGLPDSLEGKCEQTGTPTPTSPQLINITTGRQVVSVCGKNLFSDTLRQGVTVYNTGEWNNSNARITSTDWITLKAGTYTISAKTSYTASAYLQISNVTFDTSGNFYNISDVSGIWKRLPFTFTTPIDLNWKCNISFNDSAVITPDLVYDIQVEKGQATTYEEYKGNDYEINLGKNLFETMSSSTSQGVTLTPNSDGSYTLNGTTTGVAIFNKTLTTQLPPGTYTISYESSVPLASDFFVRIRKANGTMLVPNGIPSQVVGNNTTTNKTTFTSTDYGAIVAINLVTTGVTYNNVNVKIQLEKGSIASSFSPYKTPIYLGKIGTYQDYIVKTSGKNLFDISNTTSGFYNTTTGELTSSSVWSQGDYIDVSSNSQYTLSSNYTTINNSFEITEFNSNKTWISSQQISLGDGYKTITTSSNTKYIKIGFRQDRISQIQFEEGSSATLFEPYGEGQWYIHKEIGRVVLNGGENWTIYNSGTQNWYYSNINSNIDIINDSTTNNSMSNYYQINAVGNSNTNQGMYIVKVSKQIRIRYGTQDTVANFKTWLSSHNVEVYYVLNTPTNTLIEDEELINQLNEIEIFTVISEDFYN